MSEPPILSDGSTYLSHLVMNRDVFLNNCYQFERGTTINDRDHYGRTALHYAVLAKHLDQFRFLILSCNPNFDVNIKDNKGETALHYATKRQSDYRVMNLVLAGAIINVQNNKGQTPLHCASKTCETAPFDKEECIKYLLKKGANPNIRDHKNRSFVDLIKDQNIRKKFERYIYVPDIKNALENDE
jgi:ankyrin repeat protein